MIKNDILKAGLKLWREKGLDSVTLRNIATALEITHPGILYHFKTVALLKEEIAKYAVETKDVKVIKFLLVTEHQCVSHFTEAQSKEYLLG